MKVYYTLTLVIMYKYLLIKALNISKNSPLPKMAKGYC